MSLTSNRQNSFFRRFKFSSHDRPFIPPSFLNPYFQPKTEVPELDVEEWARAKPSTVRKTLEFIDETYGSIEDYLDSIGFDSTWRERLRDALLRPENIQLRRHLTVRESQRRGHGRRSQTAPPGKPHTTRHYGSLAEETETARARNPASVTQMITDVEQNEDSNSVASATPLLSGRDSRSEESPNRRSSRSHSVNSENNAVQLDWV